MHVKVTAHFEGCQSVKVKVIIHVVLFAMFNKVLLARFNETPPSYDTID